MSAEQTERGREELIAILDPAGPEATARLQTSIVSGHKADFGLMLMDPDPLKIDAVHQRFWPAAWVRRFIPTYSFVSMTEISEYVPSLEPYGQRLVQKGEQRRARPSRPSSKHTARLPIMNRQRLTPEFPP